VEPLIRYCHYNTIQTIEGSISGVGGRIMKLVLIALQKDIIASTLA
jgi:hypothetical protein